MNICQPKGVISIDKKNVQSEKKYDKLGWDNVTTP